MLIFSIVLDSAERAAELSDSTCKSLGAFSALCTRFSGEREIGRLAETLCQRVSLWEESRRFIRLARHPATSVLLVFKRDNFIPNGQIDYHRNPVTGSVRIGSQKFLGEKIHQTLANGWPIG